MCCAAVPAGAVVPSGVLQAPERQGATLKSPKNGANRSGIALQVSNDKLIKPEITAPADLTGNEGWYGIIWSLLKKDAACTA